MYCNKRKFRKKHVKKVFSFLLSIAMLLSFTAPSFAATEITETDNKEITTFDDITIDADIAQEDEIQLVTEADDELITPSSGIIPNTDVKQDDKSQIVITKGDGVTAGPTYQQAYERMVALQTKYPEGMKWTNDTPYNRNNNNYYYWKGGPIGGVNIVALGCAAFAFRLSDEAFGNLPNRSFTRGKFKYEDVKPGDVLRVNGNSHVVIVLQVTSGGVIIAEGNYNGTVHWGRVMSKAEVEWATDILITRYPVGYSEDENVDEVSTSGSEGSLKWSLTNGGVLTISGTGAMKNYTSSALPSWNAYKDKINTVVIKEGITTIGNYAFYNYSNLLSVYIPDGVTSIGTSAFQGIINIKGQTDPALLSKLVSITIPSSVKSIGDNAFRDCYSLVSASVSEGLETIGNYAFRTCTSLKYIDFPASIKIVGDGAFMECTSITSVRFKPGAANATIGRDAFTKCERLMYVVLPSNLQKISDNMFASCQVLASLYIPASVNDIAKSAFTGSALQLIHYGGSQADWEKITDIETTLNTLPGVSIEYNALFDNPFDIEEESGMINEATGGELGAPLEKDKTFTVDNITYKVTKASKEVTLTSAKSTASKVTVNTVTGPDDIEYNVTSIGSKAMKDNKKMTSLTIGANVKTIGANACSGCTKLTSVIIGKNVTSIGTSAFNGCSKITTVTFGKNVATIEASAFKGCSALKKITIPTKVKTIGANTFSGCKKMTSVTFNKNVGSIGTSAFKGCIVLTKITLPNSVKTISTSAFSGCTKIATINIGTTSKSKLTTIGKSAFSGCKVLSKMTIKSTKLSSAGKQAFKGTKSSLKVKVPSKQLKKYKKILKKAGLKDKQIVK